MPIGKRRPFPRPRGNLSGARLSGLSLLGLILYIGAWVWPVDKAGPVAAEMAAASRRMATAMEILKSCRRASTGRGTNPGDLNETSLIGLENSPMTTSIGNLAAKRTSTNPNMAALVVYLLHKAGVKRGDVIAVGASGSFPALILAALSASETMGVDPLLITSLGASQWGANETDFHWLSMMECLWSKGVLDSRPLAVALGGDEDVGANIAAPHRGRLISDIRESGLSFLEEKDFRKNIALRLRLYNQAARERPLKAFINIGGSTANIGLDARILDLEPGLTGIIDLPQTELRGMVFEMAARRIPVIHLLYMRGLAGRYGLPWDPAPLPEPARGRLYLRAVRERPLYLSLSAGYVILVLAGLLIPSRNRKKETQGNEAADSEDATQRG